MTRVPCICMEATRSVRKTQRVQFLDLGFPDLGRKPWKHDPNQFQNAGLEFPHKLEGLFQLLLWSVSSTCTIVAVPAMLQQAKPAAVFNQWGCCHGRPSQIWSSHKLCCASYHKLTTENYHGILDEPTVSSLSVSTLHNMVSFLIRWDTQVQGPDYKRDWAINKWCTGVHTLQANILQSMLDLENLSLIMLNHSLVHHCKSLNHFERISSQNPVLPRFRFVHVTKQYIGFKKMHFPC